MMISPEQETLIGRVFATYLTEHHHNDILQRIADTNGETHQPVLVNAMTLFEANMEVGDYFNAFPYDVLAIFDQILHRKAIELSGNLNEGQKTDQRMTHTLHARITGLPVCPELTRDTIPRSRDVGHFLSVNGTVIRTSVAKVLEFERDYMCTKCCHVFKVCADFDQFYTFVPPVGCPSPCGCNSYKFSCLSGGSEPAACRDYQEIKIQEQVQRLSVGSIPRSLVVVLEDDLVDSCKSGDDVTVYGVMCLRWKPFYDGTRCDVEMVLKANNIEVNNQQAAAALLMKDVHKEFEDFWNSNMHHPIAGRNQILLSLCPQVFGMYMIKLAVAMVLAGGVQRIDSSGSKIRGECHMLLAGDPGTGKSQFLKYAAKIMSRSVLTAGIGSTNAGLTVAAVKDGGDWHLEAGALVLSDGGLCCIDEFSGIKEHDRISIHEAMEQQSISVAKAGMVCKLNTRTTILAATNPKGQYDSNEPLSVNVALASPLLSRFDLVLVLLDTRNTEWDRVISSFILEGRGLPADSSGLWSMEKMKAYFSLIKQLQPQVSDEANCILTRYYQLQRQRGGRNAARTTIRMLESLSRLAEAHARLMYRETVTTEDAIVAISVMECSMQGGALLGNVNALLTSFPTEPDQHYQTQCQILLEGLNLPLLFQNEMDRLTRLKIHTSEASKLNPPTGNYQQQLRGTTFIDKTQTHDIISNLKCGATVESGLSWSHTNTPSVSPDDVITSTQENLNRKPDSVWSDMSPVTKQQSYQTKDIPNNTGSTLNHYVLSNPLETVTLASGGDKGNVEKRFKQLELNQQQYNETIGGEYGERAVCDSKSDDVYTVSNDHISSTLPSSPSYVLTQKNLPSDKQSGLAKEDKRFAMRTKNISAVLGEKIATEAETRADLHAKLSGFMFRPRKMRPSVNSHCIIASSEIQLVSQEDLACSHTDTRMKKQNQFPKFTVSRSRGKQFSEIRDSGTEASTCFTSKELDSTAVSSKKYSIVQDKAVGTKRWSTVTEDLCQQETRDSMGDDSNADIFSGTPPSKPNTSINPAPLKLCQTIVASSAAAKLSRFSFICTTDPKMTMQMNVEKSPLERDVCECLRPSSQISPNNSPVGKNSETIVPLSKIQDSTELPPGLEQGQGTKSPTKPVFKCKAKQIELTHATNQSNCETILNDSPGNYQHTASLKKRKCFELGLPSSNGSGSTGLFSRMFHFNSTELSNDVLDTDWNREVLKKAKV